MGTTDDPSAYHDRLEAMQTTDAAHLNAFRRAEQERRELIAEIMSRYTDLLEKHQDMKIDYNTLQRTNRTLYKESAQKDRELADMKLEQVCPCWSLSSCMLSVVRNTVSLPVIPLMNLGRTGPPALSKILLLPYMLDSGFYSGRVLLTCAGRACPGFSMLITGHPLIHNPSRRKKVC